MKHWEIGSYIILFAIGIGSLTGCQKVEATPTMTEHEEIVEENTEKKIDTWGEIEAGREREIYIDFPARINKVFVQEGDLVNKGAQLMSLELEEYRQKIAIKEKEMALEAVSLEGSIQSTQGESASLLALNEEAEHIKEKINSGSDAALETKLLELTNLENSLLEAKKQEVLEQELVQVGSISENQLILTSQKVVDLEGKVEKARLAIEEYKRQRALSLSKLEAQQSATQATIDTLVKTNDSSKEKTEIKQQITELELSVMEAKLNQSYFKDEFIISDLEEAVVEEISVRAGSLLSGEPQMVIKLIDNKSLLVKVYVAEDFIKEVAIGQAADIIPYADKSIAIKGKVVDIAHKATEVQGETVVETWIEALEESPYLRSGYNVDAVIYSEVKK